jgi:hypothetical protein
MLSPVFGLHPSRFVAIAYRRTFGLSGRFYDMSNPVAATETTIEIGKQNILDQRLRIKRQRALVARLGCNGSSGLVAHAARNLSHMEQALAQMVAHHAAAREQLKAKVAATRVAKVERGRSHGW